MKKLTVSQRKDYPLFLLLGVLSVLAAVLLAPFWQKTDVFFADWGGKALKLMIAAVLLVYLFAFLVPKILRGGRGAVGALTIVEAFCVLLIALGCVLTQFKVLHISGACTILGVCLFCRGTVEIFRAYYYRGGKTRTYPVWWLAIAIFMVAFGTYCFAKPLFSDTAVLWVLVLLLLLLGILLIVYGILCRPQRKARKKAQRKPRTSQKK